MTPEKIKKAWRLLKARTKGKWEANIHAQILVFDENCKVIESVAEAKTDEDAELIATAPTLLEEALRYIAKECCCGDGEFCKEHGTCICMCCDPGEGVDLFYSN